jgi:pimeloyl-ACP methyl ester carboxylesterase
MQTQSTSPAPFPIQPAPLLPAAAGVQTEGSGTAVILLHSSMSSRKQWRDLIERMRGGYRMIAIDMLGYGDAPAPQRPSWFSLDDEVRRIESALAPLLRAGERFHIVGHSYGGVVGMQLAQALPQRVRSLTLFEPIPFQLLPQRDPVVAEMHAVRRQIEARLRNGDAVGGAACFVDYWSGRGAFSRLPPERQADLVKLLPKTVLEIRAVAGAEKGGAPYRRIGAPACLLTGCFSPHAAHLATSVLAGLLPQARRFEVAAGHLAPATHPELVNPIIEYFIRATDQRN